MTAPQLNDGGTRYRLLGAKVRRGAIKLHPDLAKWELFSKTFGFFQWKKKNNLTPEQLAEFEDGFKSP